MKSKYFPEPALAQLPEWIELSRLLEGLSSNKGEWKQLRSVRTKKESKLIIPILIETARTTSSLGLRYNILSALHNRLTYPWISTLLEWLPQEQDAVSQMLIMQCLVVLVDAKSAPSIWGSIQTMPNCDGAASLVKKLYKYESLRNEIGECIVGLNHTGQLNPSMRRVAEGIGVLQKSPAGLASYEAWSTRLAKTVEVTEDDSSSVEQGNIEKPQYLTAIRELWSAEIGWEELIPTIEKLEQEHNVLIRIGRDLPRLLKRRGDEGVLVQVSSLANLNSEAMSLHVVLEDVDTATLRLMAFE